jgi:hypothetical protein
VTRRSRQTGEELNEAEHRRARSGKSPGIQAAKENNAGRPRQPFLHMPVPWVFVASYLLGAALQLLAPARLNPAGASVAIRIAGCALFLAGAGLAARALLLFRNAATTTVPGEPAR